MLMNPNQDSIANSKEMIDEIKNFSKEKFSDNLNYLYPNGHRITNQMRWYKGSRNRGLRSDMAA